MYQANISTYTDSPTQDGVHYALVNTYENLDAYKINLNYTVLPTDYILCEFVGLTTNFVRTMNFISSNYPYITNNRYWYLPFGVFATGDTGSTVVDTNSWRRSGYVFLKSPETYIMNWYINHDFTNLDVSNCTPIGLTTKLNLKRSVSDPYISAPISEFVEYNNNDVNPESTEVAPNYSNTILQVGVQSRNL